jgi:hypothetical protein
MRLLRRAFAAAPVEAVEETRALLTSRYEKVHATASKYMASDNPETALQAASVATRNARAQAALFGLESSETRLKPVLPAASDDIDLGCLDLDELAVFHMLSAKIHGQPSPFNLLEFARGVVARAEAARVAAMPAVAALPQRASPASPGAFGPPVADAEVEVDDGPIELG